MQKKTMLFNVMCNLIFTKYAEYALLHHLQCQSFYAFLMRTFSTWIHYLMLLYTKYTNTNGMCDSAKSFWKRISIFFEHKCPPTYEKILLLNVVVKPQNSLHFFRFKSFFFKYSEFRVLDWNLILSFNLPIKFDSIDKISRSNFDFLFLRWFFFQKKKKN